MDNEVLRNLYLEQKKSTVDISKISGESRSKIRRRLLKLGILRSRSDGLILLKGRMSDKLKGRTWVVSDIGRRNMSIASIKRWEKTAKGIRLKPSGYYEITRGINKGRQLHDVIMEIYIGRKLKLNEVVHHKNEVRSDNNISNLELMTKSDHCSYHAKKNYLKRKFNKKGQFI